MTEPLTAHERQSALWQKLKPYIEGRLHTARIKLEGRIDHDEANRVRGKIEELKALLSLEKEVPRVEDDSHRFKD